jgi:hypothetical protein
VSFALMVPRVLGSLSASSITPRPRAKLAAYHPLGACTVVSAASGVAAVDVGGDLVESRERLPVADGASHSPFAEMGADTAPCGPPDRTTSRGSSAWARLASLLPPIRPLLLRASSASPRATWSTSPNRAPRDSGCDEISRAGFCPQLAASAFARDASASSTSSASSIARTNAIVFIADAEADLRLGASCGCKFEGPWSDTVCCPEGRSWPEKIVKECPAPSRPMNWRRSPDPREFRASFGAARTSIH